MMKTLVTLLLTGILWMHPEVGKATAIGDTVIIELNNKSKILIYTADRTELKNLEQYDLNKMIEELNDALSSKKIERVEIEDENGDRYMKDTTIVIGEGNAKTSIKIGNMELLIDAKDWEDVENEFDEDIPVKRYTYEKERVDRTSNHFNVDFGINNWMEGSVFPDAEPYTVKPWGSWYIALNSVNKTWLTGPVFLEWGGGVSWYNWKMQNADVQVVDGDQQVEFIETTGLNTIKSKLTAPYVNLSLVPVFDFAKGKRRVKNLERGSVSFRTYHKQGLRVGVGGYAGYRIGGHSKFVYREGRGREKDKERDNFYLNNFRYGVRFQIGYKALDLFALYDLNTVFTEDRGPAGSNGLNAITFGISF